MLSCHLQRGLPSIHFPLNFLAGMLHVFLTKIDGKIIYSDSHIEDRVRTIGRSLASSRLPVRLSLPTYTRAVPLNVFPWCLILATFAQICPGTLISVKIGAQYRPKHVYIVDNTTKYFVGKRCRGKPLLRFRDNTEQSGIDDSYMYVINDTNGTYCCVSTPRVVTWTRHNFTFHVYCL
jgi:hypothetical protein